MYKVVRFWKLIVLDILGGLFIIAAVLLGWLPGPGGVPLLLVGLWLFSLNHEWGKRYIQLLRKYKDRLSDYVFIKNPAVQITYDIVSPLLIAAGLWLLYQHTGSPFKIWLGTTATGTGLALFLGNRGRYQAFRRWLKH